MGTKKANNPIGVFDSGLGGLTVVREIKRLLPNEDIIYLGDSARLPYGIKSRRQIVKFSLLNARFLIKKKIKALVIACNSSSANAYHALKKRLDIPIIDVISPVSGEAGKRSINKRVGIIGTRATIGSGAYEKEIKKANKEIKVFSQQCPLFVSLVEEGWLDNDIVRSVVRRYLEPLKRKKIDTLILGCTHYPLLKKIISYEVGRSISVIDSGPSAAHFLKKELLKRKLINPKKKKGFLKIFVTDLSPHFIKVGERFLKQPLRFVRVIKT